MHFEDSGLPWSQAEQAMVDAAVETGLNELLNFYELNMTKSHKEAVGSLVPYCWILGIYYRYRMRILHAF